MLSTTGSSSLLPSEWLALAVARAAKAARAPTSELHDAVCAYVDELRARGLAPEQVLVAVKAVVADVGLRSTGPGLLSSREGRPEDEIIDRVVAWCIEAYYLVQQPGESGRGVGTPTT